MIRRLRWRFIALAMASMALVLIVIVGGMNYLNYRSVVGDADAVLDLIAQNGGSLGPDGGMAPPDWPSGPASAPEDGSIEPPDDMSAAPDEPRGGMPFTDNAGGRWRRGRMASAEFQYETRYFTVWLDDAGEALSVDTGRIAAVDEDTAAAYARQAAQGGAAAGFIGDYSYFASSDEDGAMYVFLDCGLTLGQFRTFLAASAAVSAAGLLCVLLLIALLSRLITRPVAESYDKQRRFITDAGHELKTPLAIIEADADVLAMDVGESEWLSDIRLQVDRLSELTKSLVTLSRMEEDTSQFTLIEFPISDVVEETAASFQALALTQGKHFELSIQPMLTLRGDEKAIRQLTGILLDNALKYSPQGGEVRLTLARQGKGVRLVVYNTAESVDQASLPRLFDRFYRADAARSSSTGGYGIGLSIARAIVAGHRGRIAASSADGKSMTMTVTLP